MIENEQQASVCPNSGRRFFHCPDSETSLKFIQIKTSFPIDQNHLAALLGWFDTHARDLPWRRTTDPYAIWVSEIMLQQTQVKTVLPFWSRWMDVFPSLIALAEAEPAHVLKLWQGLGYYSRARNLQAAAQLIRSTHGGRFPDTLVEILTLPGVGRYTAGAIGSIAFNQPWPIVDGNIIRVLSRFLGITDPAKSSAVQKKLWQVATQLVSAAPQGRHGDLNQALMELGATVCSPRRPACDECPLNEGCHASKHQNTHQIPNLEPTAISTPRWFVAAIIQQENRWLLQQRREDVVNAGFWELPVWEIDSRSAGRARLGQELGSHLEWDLRGTVKHTITRYRMTVDFYAPEAMGKLEVQQFHQTIPAARWVSELELSTLPLVNAHSKALRQNIWHKPLEH